MSDIKVSPLRLRRGAPPTHGFFTRTLNDEEAAMAAAFAAQFREAYPDLDETADAVLLALLSNAAVIAARAPPEGEGERAANVYGARVRLVRDLLDSLALSRKERRRGADPEEARRAELNAVLSVITKKPESPAGDSS